MLSYFGCDQSQVQRYLTARSVDESKLSLLMSAVLKIPLQLLVLGLGVSVFVYYQFQAPPLVFEPGVATQITDPAQRSNYAGLERNFQQNWMEKRKLAKQLGEGKSGQQQIARFNSLHAREIELRREALGLLAKSKNQSEYSDVNYIFPKFITTVLPVGMLGLMIAAIFAAAMSSVSSELSALASTSVIDVYKRHIHPEDEDSHYLRAARLLTLFWGLFACGAAYYARNLGALIEVVNRFGSFFYGALLGVFVLALGFKRANSAGAFYGLISGVLVVSVFDNLPWLASSTGSTALLTLSEHSRISFLWYNVIGAVTVVLVGLLISAAGRRDHAA